MVVTKNGMLVLDTLEDLDLLIESEKQELYEQFGKYKKYSNQLTILEEWDVKDSTKFIYDIEKLIEGNKLNIDNEYRLAVYIGRYPSYFYSISNLLDNNKEEALKERLKLLTSIEKQIKRYTKELENNQWYWK